MPTRILTTAPFERFVKKERIQDVTLIEAIERVERGLVDADLGGGVLKLRIARPDQGRSGGYRTIVACIVNSRAFFLYGYSKNDLDNIGHVALKAFRGNASDLQNLTETRLSDLIETGQITEIHR